MRIFCVGKNYGAHVAEMNDNGGERPTEPVIFTKPDTALVKGNDPVYYPSHISQEVHHEVELVVRVGKSAKGVDPALALDYLDGVAVGIDFTLRDRQSALKAKGMPWDIAKGFDQSAPISDIYPLDHLGPLDDISLRLDINGTTVQEGRTSQMIFTIPEVVAYVTQFFTLRQGDLIFTGTPSGVGPIAVGDQLTAYANDQALLDFAIR